ncbi:calcium ion transporter [Moniliophthora roreri MCA 2997]|uniref:Vacuolar calcium ion transporter n=2 Tax=Moniliophthora roreri TaxID=221103 RepID=V2X9G1_MONRO|nr:calcium ion transporter [Moniliophthora roreri MCA 2997]KAI3608117.1 calcium ion transporter [Moniliophthora roreri]
MAKNDTEGMPRHENAVRDEPVTTGDNISLTDMSERIVLSPIPSTKQSASPPFRKRNFVERIWHILGVEGNVQRAISLAVLILTPLSWAIHFGLPTNATLVFVFTFLALIPQAQILGYYTEQLSLSSGEKIAALLNASLGNAVELIVAIIALVKCELEVVQASLIGSVISNLLLVNGLAILVGGAHNGEQIFSSSDAQLQSALLAVAFSSVLFPTIFYFIETEKITDDVTQRQTHLLVLSRGTAVVLIVIYGTYLWYNMVTTRKRQDEEMESSESKSCSDNAEVPLVSPWLATAILVIDTALIAVTAEFLVSSINGLVAESPLSKQFVALILLPIAGNAAEHASAVMMAWRNKMTMALDIAIGSSIQISIFLLPLIVVLAWILGKPLTLYFDLFQTIVLIVTVFIVHYIVQDGKTVWMEGVILCSLYVILCVAFQVYPGSESAASINSCL